MIGCFSTGYYITRFLTGQDIRQDGSGQTGARNVGRRLGRKGFAITFAGDFLKGALVIYLAGALDFESWAVVLCMLAVVAGHIYPVQLWFKGGRGVSVVLGAVLVYDWRLILVVLVVFGLVYLLSRAYMLSGLAAIASLAAGAFFLRRPAVELTGILLVTLLVLFAHRSHIAGLFRGRWSGTDTEGW